MSPLRPTPLPQEPMWGSLSACRLPVALVVGSLDPKFADIGAHTLRRLVGPSRPTTATTPAAALLLAPVRLAAGAAGGLGRGSDGGFDGRSGGVADTPGGAVARQLSELGHALVEVEGAGHAVHLERPEVLLAVLREVAAWRGGGGAAAAAEQ